jgi:hypothetical protein
MQVSGTSLYSSFAASRSSNPRQAPSASSTTDAGQSVGGGVSMYDFTNMSPAQMQDTINGLIRSGKMSLDDSSSLVSMIPTGLTYAGPGAPSAASLDSVRNTPMDFLARLQAGIDGARSRGDAQNAEHFARTLNVLQSLQGTPSGVDVIA